MSRDRSKIVIGLVVAAVLGAVIALLAGTNGARGYAALPIVPIAIGVGVVAAAAAIAAVAVIRSRHARRPGSPSRMETEAARLGLTYRASEASGFHHDFGPLPGIPRGGTIKHVFAGTLDGRRLTVFEHSYVINTGQAVIPVYHTAYLTEAPEWPSVTVSRRHFFGRLMDRLGWRRGLHLEDPVFNATMRIRTDDEAFALTLLHPEMQQFLAGKRSAVWRIHAGCCALIYSGSLRVERMEASLERLRRFWALVPPELDAW